MLSPRGLTLFILKTFLLVCLCTAFLFPTQFSYSDNDKEQELFLVAEKAFEDGFYDVAIRYINQLLQEYPQTQKHVQANLLLGQCYFFKSQYLQAYDIFNNLLQYEELKDATLYWLGETYLKGPIMCRPKSNINNSLSCIQNLLIRRKPIIR